MADMKQEVKSVDEPQSFAVSNQSDPKNLQELTQYVSWFKGVVCFVSARIYFTKGNYVSTV